MTAMMVMRTPGPRSHQSIIVVCTPGRPPPDLEVEVDDSPAIYAENPEGSSPIHRSQLGVLTTGSLGLGSHTLTPSSEMLEAVREEKLGRRPTCEPTMHSARL